MVGNVNVMCRLLVVAARTKRQGDILPAAAPAQQHRESFDCCIWMRHGCEREVRFTIELLLATTLMADTVAVIVSLSAATFSLLTLETTLY